VFKKHFVFFIMLEDLYRAQVLAHAREPHNRHALPDAFSAEARRVSCGDMLTLFVRFADGKVQDASFVGEGCAVSLASASLFTDFLKGKKGEELDRLEETVVYDLLHTQVALARQPCALLVFSAFWEVREKIREHYK
jgi:nitrogen fixation NifU-like protein